MEESPDTVKPQERLDLILELRSQPTPFHMRGISFMLMMGGFNEEADHYYVLKEEDVVLGKQEKFAMGGPSFNLRQKEAQMLFDDLWQAGFRPSDGYKGPEAFEAQGSHLDDMRKIVFKKLRIDDGS